MINERATRRLLGVLAILTLLIFLIDNAPTAVRGLLEGFGFAIIIYFFLHFLAWCFKS